MRMLQEAFNEIKIKAPLVPILLSPTLALTSLDRCQIPCLCKNAKRKKMTSSEGASELVFMFLKGNANFYHIFLYPFRLKTSYVEEMRVS